MKKFYTITSNSSGARISIKRDSGNYREYELNKHREKEITELLGCSPKHYPSFEIDGGCLTVFGCYRVGS